MSSESKTPIMVMNLNQNSLGLKSDSVILIVPPFKGKVVKLCIGYVGEIQEESSETL